jgi:hypothetical protein
VRRLARALRARYGDAGRWRYPAEMFMQSPELAELAVRLAARAAARRGPPAPEAPPGDAGPGDEPGDGEEA